MMKLCVLFGLVAAANAGAVTLGKDNIEAEMAGKNSFIKVWFSTCPVRCAFSSRGVSEGKRASAAPPFCLMRTHTCTHRTVYLLHVLCLLRYCQKCRRTPKPFSFRHLGKLPLRFFRPCTQ